MTHLQIGVHKQWRSWAASARAIRLSGAEGHHLQRPSGLLWPCAVAYPFVSSSFPCRCHRWPCPLLFQSPPWVSAVRAGAGGRLPSKVFQPVSGQVGPTNILPLPTSQTEPASSITTTTFPPPTSREEQPQQIAIANPRYRFCMFVSPRSYSQPYHLRCLSPFTPLPCTFSLTLDSVCFASPLHFA